MEGVNFTLIEERISPVLKTVFDEILKENLIEEVRLTMEKETDCYAEGDFEVVNIEEFTSGVTYDSQETSSADIIEFYQSDVE